MPQFTIDPSDVPDDGEWKSFSRDRETVGRGNIEFDPGRIPGGLLCLRLRDRRGKVFTRVVCWTPGDAGRKLIAEDVLPETQFSIDAHGGGKGHILFEGKLFTA